MARTGSGNAGEAKVLAALVERGFDVSFRLARDSPSTW